VAWFECSFVYTGAHADLECHRIFLTKADDFVFWLTDTTRFEPALCGSQAAWAVAGTLTFDLRGVVQLPANVISLLRAIYDCGKDFIEEN
jgi:hypothetical protein